MNKLTNHTQQSYAMKMKHVSHNLCLHSYGYSMGYNTNVGTMYEIYKKKKLKYRYATYSVVNQQKAENSLCHIADKLRTNSGRHIAVEISKHLYKIKIVITQRSNCEKFEPFHDIGMLRKTTYRILFI